jgi:putative redox protein
MEILIDFPGGARVDAHFGDLIVKTDQPGADKQVTDPTPFGLFLSSIGTCAGIYVLGFCQQRNLPTEGVRIIERVQRDAASGMVTTIDLEIQVPETFPEKYYESLVRSADLCAVKKHLENPPKFNVYTRAVSAA